MSAAIIQCDPVYLEREGAGQQLAGCPAPHQRLTQQPGIGGPRPRSGPHQVAAHREVGVGLEVDQKLLRAAVALAAVIPTVHPVTDVRPTCDTKCYLDGI